ncbi:MAG: glycosyltransferase [Candidatus Omnitrophica bacterium]|nr:glycosyltransferase [Candidatus Omnitrophota bacterium]
MKNVILIAYSFPPDRNIGALRSRGIAKYLPHFDWNVFVITPLSSMPREAGFNIIETYPWLRQKLGYWKKKKTIEYSKIPFYPPGYKRFFSGLLELVPFPDSKSGWILPAVYSGIELINQKEIKAIISTYGPASSHFIAHKLKKIFPKIIWVADFRDLWSHNSFHEHCKLKLRFIELIEKRVLSNADLITTVSEPLARELELIHGRKTTVIPNGFDPEEYGFEVGIDNKFSVIYTGSLYQQKRNPEILFMAIKKIIFEDVSIQNDLEVNFYGTFCKELQNMIEKYNLEKIVKQRGMLSREEIIKAQKRAQVLLLVNRNLPEDKGVYTGKLFEYLGARRPILAIGYEDSVVKDLLGDTKAGVYCWKFEQVYHVLKDWYFEWKKEKIVKYRGIEEKILSYSHKEMAKKFSRLLENFTCS